MKIHRGEIEATALLSEVPREQWGRLLSERRHFAKFRLSYDCRELLHFVEDAEKMAPALGFATVDDFVRDGLGVEPRTVDWAIAGIKTLTPDQPIPFADAVARGRAIADTFASAAPTEKQGGKRPKAGRKPVSRAPKDAGRSEEESTLPGNLDSEPRGNRSAYLAGRIKAKAKRDPKAAEVAAKVEAGEYESMRAAARDAGVLKPPCPVRLAAAAIAKVPFQRFAELACALPIETRRGLLACLKDSLL